MVKLRLNRFWTVSIKLFLSVAGLVFVYYQVDVEEVSKAFSSVSYLLLGFAFIIYNLSKLISSFRLSWFLKDAGVRITQIANLKLYYIGMFYNLFLPGGIGGDGYKIFVLSKNTSVGWKKLTQAILLDRVSGALALLFLTLVLFFPMANVIVPEMNSFRFLIALSAVAIYVAYFLALRRFFPAFLPSFITSTVYALMVQLLQVFCSLLILASLGISEYASFYVLVFLLSSLAATLPLTIGGIGIRETVFILAATWFPFSSGHAVTFSLLFFLITALSSLVGVLFNMRENDWHLAPKQKKSRTDQDRTG